MKLYYFHDPRHNFGDDLNPWLWPKLIPDLLDDDPSELFVGIGTLLNRRVPTSPRKHVFGSGVGYGEMPYVDDKWIFHAVRGPDSARALGLAPAQAVCDSAILLRLRESRRGGTPAGPVGFIPTGQTIDRFDWSGLCAQIGIRCISCRMDVEAVIESLLSCRMVMCEAMHGAIVCDALRIPWLPVACSEDVLSAKWQDWMATLDLPYEPTIVRALFRESETRMERLKENCKRALFAVGLGGSITPPQPSASLRRDIERGAELLDRAARRTPLLSDDGRIAALTSTLAERLERVRMSRLAVR